MKAILISFGALLVAGMRGRRSCSSCATGRSTTITCPADVSGLRRNDTIMYRTVLNQLCNIDVFTVLENIGGGFMPGASCTLGMFYPVSQEEADEPKTKQRE